MPDGTLHGRRILVVEDEFFLADDLSRALRKAGAVVLGPVATVQNELDLLAAGAVPDAVSLDLNLGGDSAHLLADALIARAVPFVFTTGYEQADIPDRYAQVPHLEKPVEPETVLAALANLLSA